jgi:dynein heavy chain
MSKDNAQTEATVFDFKLMLPQGDGEGADVTEPDYSPWVNFVEAYVPKALGDDPDSESFTNLFIETSGSSRTCAVMDLLAQQGKPILLVGNAGTGKTKLLHNYVENQLAKNEHFVQNTINMNYFMDARLMQAQVEQVLDKRSGSTFGPPAGKHCLCLIDDLNLPYIEEYGTQNSLELLRQLIDQRGVFDREDPGFYKTIQDVQYLAAMNPTAGSFTVNERVQRHFSTFNYAMPDAGNLKMVYGAILRGHFELSGFEPELLGQVDNFVNASIYLYQNVAQKFMPSAIKFVYNWNMRELSNIFRGMTKAQSSDYSTPSQLLRLWLHESYRVFGDRLITESDRTRFDDLISDAAKKHFVVNEGDMDNTIEHPLICTQFHNDARTYTCVTDYVKLKENVKDRLDEYNESNAVMNLELFHEALEHVTRVVRIIQNPEGSGMLVGVGGSGKQSLTKLSAYICDYTVQTIPVTSTYTFNDFKENLKIWYTMAGVKNLQFVLLIADRQIVDEQFLVCINDILSSGWVPGLFQKDEIDAIYGSNRKDAKAEGIMDTPEANHEFFVDRVKRNLHIVMAFSPFGEAFRRRARRFPAIINCTVIDWFHPWSRDALVAVGARFLADVDVEDEMKDNISHHMAEVHQSVLAAAETYFKVSRRRVYTTPKSFLELINFFKNLLTEKRESLKAQVDRLGTGLQTLINTAKDVAELQEDLKVTMVKVAEKQKSTDELLETMGVQKAKTAVEQDKAKVEQDAADKAAAEASAIKADAEKELGAAKPMLLAAQDAVNCLDKSSLTELKSLSTPPSGVDLVTSCCLMMLENEYKNHAWARAKKMMAKVDHFLQRLKGYNHETMSEALIGKLQKYVDDPVMEYESMFKKSQAAANLCTWIQNIFKCNRIFVRVKPLMEKLAQAEAAQAAAEGKLAAVNKLVAQVEAALAKLEETFVQATNEKAKVVAQAKACEERLSLAQRLIGGLSSERKRWTVEVDNLKVQESNITGDALLASAFVSYVGAFDAHNRVKLWSDTWMQDLNNRVISTSEGVDPLKLLASDAQIAQMVSEGIPSDRISLENGALVVNAKRWPLLIDPQLQAMNWLRVRFEDPKFQLKIIQMNSAKWMTTLSNAISEGTVVFIENLTEELDASIEPVLAQQVYKKGYGRYLNLGGEAIEYDDKFQLYMQTRLFNPVYLPEVQAQVTMINFIATESGLEDQLLAKVVAHEAPELELRKQELQRKFNQYKIQLINLEDELLERLANAPDDILSDVPLIEGLEATKATAEEVNKAVELGKTTEIEINKSRELYRPAASEGAMLYFIITSLEAVDHMYQYSLDAFEYFFAKALDVAETPEGESSDANILQQRVANLRFSLRLTIYTWVCRGLFEKHKLILLCQILFQLMRRGRMDNIEFNITELDFLIRGPKKPVEDSPVDWLPNSAWFAVSALAEFPEFAKLPQDIQDAPSRFKEWFNHVSPETEKLPLDWAALDKNFFKKLLVLRCLRPDRMTVALATFLGASLPSGKMFVDCDLTNNSFTILQDVYKDSSKSAPLYFILSPGTDVVADLDMLATQEGFVRGETYHNVSMGQGQDVIAERYMNIAAQDGHWVILNNVHLMPRWMKKVEKMLDDFALDEKTNSNFRVFLTSEPSKGIPIGVLNRCIKLTNEPPTGLKANLKRAFSSFTEETFNDWDSKTRSIIFGLCHFHALMLERKKFGPMGFNMMYPFSLGDLRDSSVCLNNYMENVESRIPWQDLRYIFGEIMYGGHIVNDFDRLLCNTYLDFIMDDGLLEEMEFYPFVDGETQSFKCPAATTYNRYLEHIEEELKEETPIAYGLHPNAQIDFRTQQSIEFFNRLIDLTPKDAVGGGDGEDAGQSPRHIAESALNDILERLTPEDSLFNLQDIREMIGEELNPFQNVFLQEMQQMNKLVKAIMESLNDLNLGFAGELTMSDAMEELMDCLYLDKVPSSWAKLAWPSRRSLAPWLDDLQKRILQLREWETDVTGIPTVTWLAGMMNPQSFLTAIMQQAAQKNGWELDKLFIQTEVMKKFREQVDNASREGAFIDGLNLEGARWNVSAGNLEVSKPREMFCAMPVMFCKSNFTTNMPTSGVYMCPLYKTRQRGPTYVALAQLKSKAKSAQWVMAGVALIMDVSE